MAVQVEKDGLAFYSGCAAARQSEAIAELFAYLAEQEKQHVKVFTEMKKGLAEHTLPESYAGETDAYIASLVSDRVFPANRAGAMVTERMEQVVAAVEITDEMAAIETALDMEKQSILLYSGIRNLVRQSEQEVMDRIIEEEREHIRKLLSLRRSLGGKQDE
jgi:rubrerythrin